MKQHDYLLAGKSTELERLRVQSRVWEPAGVAFLDALPIERRRRALDVGCGVLGWLRVLAKWISDDGRVFGIDVDPAMLDAARAFVDEERLDRVELLSDDLFASALPPASFDLVHARFQIAPLGRAEEQLDAYLRLIAPGGWIVLEDPDTASWQFSPEAPHLTRLIALIGDAFREAGGDLDAGRGEFALLRSRGLTPELRAASVALPPGHPYLRLPLQFAAALEPRIVAKLGSDEFVRLRAGAESELADGERWGTTFTLVQTAAKVT